MQVKLLLPRGLAVAAAFGAHLVLYAPKANITVEFRYEHHGEALKPSTVPVTAPGVDK